MPLLLGVRFVSESRPGGVLSYDLDRKYTVGKSFDWYLENSEKFLPRSRRFYFPALYKRVPFQARIITGGGKGCTHVVHGRSLMAIDPRRGGGICSIIRIHEGHIINHVSQGHMCSFLPYSVLIATVLLG